jgi:UDP-N-acetylmuramate dehydrogenase
VTEVPRISESAARVAERLRRDLGRPLDVDVPLAGFTTYRLGGPAALFVEPASLDELEALDRALAADPMPVLVVGRGSNLLVSESGFPGVAVHLKGDFEAIELDDESVRAGGAVALPVLARRAAAAGLAGLEFYVGIPGSVGGAVRMNAGGHGQDTAAVLASASSVALGTGQGERSRQARDLAFGYRRSAVEPHDVVTRAVFTARRDDAAACEERLAEIVRWRREHQPGGSNAGSVFANPKGDSAGRIIDACGLKGFRVGGAVVSRKHANFFQADETATPSDVWSLVHEVRRRVEEATGVLLEPELRMVGFGAEHGGGSAG